MKDRPLSLSKKIFRNIASNWAGYAVNAVVTFFLTPFVLHQLGDTRYGVWVLISSITGHYGLLDLGFRGGVTQYLTRYLAVKDYEKANECMSSSVAVLSALGTLVTVLSVIVAYVAIRLYHFPPGIGREVYCCILIIGFSTGLGFAFFPFGAVFTANQRYDLSNLVGISTRFISAGAIYAALHAGYGLIGISAALCGSNFIDYFIRSRVAYRIMPQLRISWRHVRIIQLRGVGSFGLWNFMISVSGYADQYAQMLLIGYFLPIKAAAYYGLAVGLSGQIRAGLTSMAQVFYPAATEIYSRGDQEALKRLYVDGTRLMLLIAIPAMIIAWLWADDFYNLWIGGKYLSGTEFPSVARLFRVILIGTAFIYVSRIGGQILLGAGRVSLMAKCVFVEALLNLSLSLISIRTYGLVGVAASSVASLLLVRVFVFPLALDKTVALKIRNLLQACVRPLAVGVLLIPLLFCIRLASRPAADWFHLAIQGVLAGACSVVAVLVIGVSADERRRFLVQPVRHLFERSVVAPASKKHS